VLKILLTNDDGIDAPGLAALRQSVSHAVASYLPSRQVEITVVAPDRGRSECGHSVDNLSPLVVQPQQRQPDEDPTGADRVIDGGWHAVSGTPVDCIRVALCAMQYQPDVVLSGINAGANLGVNLMVSGTFAAAREASLLGIPAMAISHYRRPDVQRTWTHCPQWLENVIGPFLRLKLRTPSRSQGADSVAAPAADGGLPYENIPLWNVNLPASAPDNGAVPDVVRCPVDRCPIWRTGVINEHRQVDFRLDFHGRPREPGRDVEHCFAGRITISELEPFV